MKVFVKTLEGTHFEIEVKPEHTVADVKKNIETIQGSDIYPTAQQTLTHEGKVLKDPTTLEENKVADSSFIVISLSKGRLDTGADSPAGAAGNLAFLRDSPQFQSLRVMVQANPQLLLPMVQELGKQNPHLVSLIKDNQAEFVSLIKEPLEHGENVLGDDAAAMPRDVIVAPEECEASERAPQTSATPPAPAITQTPPVVTQTTQPAAVPSNGPNANSLDIFPQGLPYIDSADATGIFELLRNSPQFRELRAMVQANPQLLQPMLQELAKQNPRLVNLISEHQDDFLRLINETDEDEENELGDVAAEIPQAMTATPDEREAIESPGAMRFDRA